MVNDFTSAGFTWYTGDWVYDFSQLYRGDILLWVGDPSEGTGHTELYIGGGETAAAHHDENGGVEGLQGGDQGGEITIDSAIAGGYWWEGILRWEHGDATSI